MSVFLSNSLSAHNFTSENSKKCPLKMKVEKFLLKTKPKSYIFASWLLPSGYQGPFLQDSLISCPRCWVPGRALSLPAVSQGSALTSCLLNEGISGLPGDIEEWMNRCCKPKAVVGWPERPWMKAVPWMRHAGCVPCFQIFLKLPALLKVLIKQTLLKEFPKEIK